MLLSDIFLQYGGCRRARVDVGRPWGHSWRHPRKRQQKDSGQPEEWVAIGLSSLFPPLFLVPKKTCFWSKNEEQAGQTQSLHTDAAMAQERPQQVRFVWPCYPGLQSFQGHTQGALAQVVRTKWTLISCSTNEPVPTIIKKKTLDPKKRFYLI